MATKGNRNIASDKDQMMNFITAYLSVLNIPVSMISLHKKKMAD